MRQKKVEKLVNKIIKNENLKSIAEVFELYPLLGELYYKELRGEEVNTSEFNEVVENNKKLLLG